MKYLAKRVGLLLVSGLVMHGAIVACSGGDSASTAYAGPGSGGAGGSGVSATSTAAGNATTAGSAGTGNGCGCAQPTTVDVDVTEFQMLPVDKPTKYSVAVLPMPGRSTTSLLGAQAFGKVVNPGTPLDDGDHQAYRSVEVLYLDNAVFVYAKPSEYSSIRFIVPASP